MEQMCPVPKKPDFEFEDEYLWALRVALARIGGEDLEWKERKPTILMSDPTSILTAKREKGDDAQITTIMASLVPDEVIYNINDYSIHEINGCLLFGDVSGFTDICEKYTAIGQSGISKLTQVLNSYISQMVQEVLSCNGDILNFSGDAFVALWKETQSVSLRDAINEAIDCALIIQKTLGSYKTDVGVLIKIKVAIASGRMLFALLGDQKDSHYLITGELIWDLKVGGDLCSAGDIIVTNNTWNLINANEYIVEPTRFETHFKILGVGPNWRSNINKDLAAQQESVPAGRQITRRPMADLSRQQSAMSASSSFISQNSSLASSETNLYNEVMVEFTKTTIEDNPTTEHEYSLRPSIDFAVKFNFKNQLKKFMLGPIMRTLEAGDPLEYLTEMRMVVVVFINIVLPQKLDPVKVIHVAKQAYSVVGTLVKSMHGWVNKVNNFDKDLLVLIIFGLRGFKQEFECGNALKCALECRKSLLKIDNVLSASVGVTTGNTYCGVFGHSLRREYTVISLTVNKAARLMISYPNMVTCDRETFLRSKMEAKNFTLQPYKVLKGIQEPGPIYEFQEKEWALEPSAVYISYPLLGRDNEVKLYLFLFNTWLNSSKSLKLKDDNRKASNKDLINILIIRGEARQGKTRLLQELVYRTPKGTGMVSLNLHANNFQIPNSSIKIVMLKVMELAEESSVHSIEKKLVDLLKLDNMNSHLYNYLNYVFDVSFKVSETTENKSRSEIRAGIKNVMTRLFNIAFEKIVLITIDNIDYMDEPSWELLGILMKLNKVFIVGTICKDRQFSSTGNDVLTKNPAVKIVNLHKIDKWYHVGLVCQMFDLLAIPVELEEAVHLGSNGNPGWIESYILTLLQTNTVYVSNIPRKVSREKGFVEPPLFMMVRMTPADIKMYNTLSQEASNIKVDKNFSERWKLYIGICKDSFTDLMKIEMFKNHFSEDVVIPVARLNSNFKVPTATHDLTGDVLTLKIFDSLKSYEQLLLKCSSVLGEVVLRSWLVFIMPPLEDIDIAKAIKKLFEIRVLSCNHGTFINGVLDMTSKIEQDPTQDLIIKCHCQGLHIPKQLKKLPKYASCGYFRFQSINFLQTTYNLLTINQRIQYHSRALLYMETKTRKCKSCGMGLMDLKNSEEEYNDNTHYVQDTHLHFTHSRDEQEFFDKRNMNESGSVFSMLMIKSQNIWQAFTRKLTENTAKYQLVPAFETDKFRDCTCDEILNSYYRNLVTHTYGADEFVRYLNSLIVLAYSALIADNLHLALKTVNDGLEHLFSDMTNIYDNSWELDFKRGKLMSLRGIIYTKISRWSDAKQQLLNSLKYFGIDYPRYKIQKKFWKIYLNIRQAMWVYFTPYTFMRKKIRVYEVAYYNNISECLAALAECFIKEDNWSDAMIAATWSLHNALTANTNFNVVCAAFEKVFHVAQHFDNYALCKSLETYVIKLCLNYRDLTSSSQVFNVCHVYRCILRARLYMSDLTGAVEVGYIMWEMAANIKYLTFVSRLLPSLCIALLQKFYISDAFCVITELEYYVNTYPEVGKLWYYTCCLVFQFEIGCTVETYKDAEKYFFDEGSVALLKNNAAGRALCIALWLWCVRTENWENAEIWRSNAWGITRTDEDIDAVEVVWMNVYLLEGLLLYLVHCMDNENVSASGEALDRLQILYKYFANTCHKKLIFKPRFMHLKALYILIKGGSEKDAYEQLKVAAKEAEKLGNLLEPSWISFTETIWKTKIIDEQYFLWQDYAQPQKHLDYSQFKIMDFGKPIHFSLKLPKTYQC